MKLLEFDPTNERMVVEANSGRRYRITIANTGAPNLPLMIEAIEWEGPPPAVVTSWPLERSLSNIHDDLMALGDHTSMMLDYINRPRGLKKLFRRRK